MTANGNMPAFKQGEVLRWINSDENVLSGITELMEHTFIDCERSNGEVVVLPSECARVLRDKLEIAYVLNRRPRAELIEDYISQSPKELYLKVVFLGAFVIFITF
ncbi:unnamed protein product [Dibothriocephalus latus]|uniref:Uncharacterized protein n=1 Tax=Dibothriocephalus latus TaxID=60516 RepID=A0A3P7MKM4_DIBLA|nr:unnamed protein product [Dibothriocephalus latus]